MFFNVCFYVVKICVNKTLLKIGKKIIQIFKKRLEWNMNGDIIK